MNILVYGMGVIGSVYGWQLAQAGHSVTHLVRPGRGAALAQDGLSIQGVDLRGKKKQPIEVAYRPRVREQLTASAGYELIVVPLQWTQLNEVLPALAKAAGSADILFFQNVWTTEAIEAYLEPSQYLFGFPRLVAGRKEGNRIECTIYSNPGQASMLGEVDGQSTPRLERIRGAFKEAGLRPQVAPQILGWLAAHYVEWIGPVGAMLQAGSVQAFAKNPRLIRQSILATREGLAVCQARGLNVQKAAPQNLQLLNSLPLFICVVLARMQYRMPEIQDMFVGHLTHGVAEISAQYEDVVAEGGRLGVPMPCLERFGQAYAAHGAPNL